MLDNEPLFTSFFDDEEKTKTHFEFIKPNTTHQKYISDSALLASTLSCQGSNSWSKRGIHALHNQIIVFYANESSKMPSFVLPLTHTRLTSLNPAKTNCNYGFRLTRNGACFDFYSPNKQTIESWMNALKSVCVLSNFHDEFKANKTLGRGGFAKVYLVESKTDKNSLFAAKAFCKADIISSSKEKAKPALINEIEIMRSLSHENIVKLYQVYETENSIYLLLELIKGKTLYEILKKSSWKKPLTPTEIRENMQSILGALDYISSQGIMHRDLKPSNILVEKGGKIKIADFGLATPIKASKYIYKKCGTPGYMAPEVFKYDEKNPSTYYNDKADIFSVGCIFFFMLFGYPFFDNHMCQEISVLNKKYDMDFESVGVIKREINNLNGKLDKEGLNLLLKLLEPDPEKRITASDALMHPYIFSPLMIQKNPSIAGSLTRLNLNHKAHSELKLSTSPKNKNHQTAGSLNESSDPGSFIALCPARFTDKDSIYLEVTKHMSLNKSEDVDMGSAYGSLNGQNNLGSQNNLGTSLNTLSLSTFAKPGHMQFQNNLQKRSFRNLTQLGSPYLKVAIKNQIEKQKAETENELPDEPVRSNRSARNRTELIYYRQNTTIRDSTDDVSQGSSEIEVEGEMHEETEVEKYMNQLKTFVKENVPSKRSKGRFHTVASFSMKN